MKPTIDFFLLGLDHPSVNAWFSGVYQSFFTALEEQGWRVTYSDAKPNRSANLLVVPLGGGQDQSSARAMQDFSGPVILYIGAALYWFRKGFLERWRDEILFTYGFDVSTFSPKAFSELNIPYYHFPFGSNPTVMRPLNLPKLYDVIFVGNAGSGFGRHKYAQALMKAAGKRKILFIGPGWERYGFPSQSIAWGDFLNIIYNLAHICVNICNDQQKLGADSRLDANNRLFDLAMAGCFQVSNAPQVVRCYFDAAEVVAVDPPDEWVSAIMYFLDHPSEMEPFRIAARKRALEEHTWQHRAKMFLEMIESHLPTWRECRPATSHWKKMIRMRDVTLPPYGLREGMAKLKRRILRKSQPLT